MSTKYPPSSPTRWDDVDHNEVGRKNGMIMDQLNLLSDDYTQIREHSESPIQNRKLNHYPTPNPSSSTGIAIPSSPVLTNSIEIGNNELDQEQLAFDSSFVASEPSITKIKSPGLVENNISSNVPTNKSEDGVNTIPILINPHMSQYLIIGRKKAVCDIQLPSLKNISRQHAFLSYNDSNNKLKIECVGTNGMVILLPSNVDFVLSKMNIIDQKYTNPDFASYNLEPLTKSGLNDNQRLLSRHNNLISFAILKNESIQIPLINGTILDFRQVRTIIKVTTPTSQDVDNDTETEDEMTAIATNSDDFLHTPTKKLISVRNCNSPITEEISIINQRSSPHKDDIQECKNIITTPQKISLTKQRVPTTPVKNKKNIEFNKLRNMESPISMDSNMKRFKFKPLKFKSLNPFELPQRKEVSDLERLLLSTKVNPFKDNKIEPVIKSKPINLEKTVIVKDEIKKTVSKQDEVIQTEPSNNKYDEDKNPIKQIEMRAKIASDKETVSIKTNSSDIGKMEVTGEIKQEGETSELSASNLNKKEFVKADSIKNVTEDVTDNIQEHVTENIQEDVIDNITENIEENTIENIKENTTDKIISGKLNKPNKNNRSKIKNTSQGKDNLENSNIENSKLEEVSSKTLTKTKRSPSDASLNPHVSEDNIKVKPTTKKIKTQESNMLKTQDILLNIESKDIDPIEIQRIVINNLAFSNLQQTPLSHLIDINTATRSLKKSEMRTIIHDVSCIGEIKRHGKDAAGKLLEEEYYYDLENDEDEERRNLMISLKGGRNSGLRSCRKTHKQYYWKKPPKK